MAYKSKEIFFFKVTNCQLHHAEGALENVLQDFTTIGNIAL